MIKGVVAKADGTIVLVLGLSGENVTRLAAGEPIHVAASDMANMGFPRSEAIIMYGKTEQAIVDQLRAAGLMPPGTPAHNACADPTCTQEHAR